MTLDHYRFGKKDTYIIGLDMIAQKNLRIRVWCECFFPAGDFLSMLYSTRVTLTVFELYPGTGSVEKTVTNGLGRMNFRRTTNAIVWG